MSITEELTEKVEETKKEILTLIEDLKGKIETIEHKDGVPVYFMLHTDVQIFLEWAIQISDEIIQKVKNLED